MNGTSHIIAASQEEIDDVEEDDVMRRFRLMVIPRSIGTFNIIPGFRKEILDQLFDGSLARANAAHRFHSRVQMQETRIWAEVSRILRPIADFTSVDDYNRYVQECNTSMDVKCHLDHYKKIYRTLKRKRKGLKVYLQMMKEVTNIQASRLAIVGEPYAEVFLELFHVLDAKQNELRQWIVTIQNGIEVVEREWKILHVQKEKDQRIWDVT